MCGDEARLLAQVGSGCARQRVAARRSTVHPPAPPESPGHRGPGQPAAPAAPARGRAAPQDRLGGRRHRRLPIAEDQREVDLPVERAGPGPPASSASVRATSMPGLSAPIRGPAPAAPGWPTPTGRRPAAPGTGAARRRRPAPPRPWPAAAAIASARATSRRAGLGRGDPARAAQQQGAPRLPLQLAQVLADRGLGPAELAGRRTEGAGADDGTEDHQSARVHRPSMSPKHRWGNAKEAKSSQGGGPGPRMDGCGRSAWWAG